MGEVVEVATRPTILILEETAILMTTATPRPEEIAILTWATIHLAVGAILTAIHPAEVAAILTAIHPAEEIAILMTVGIRSAVIHTQEELSSCSGTEETSRPSQAAMAATEAKSSGHLQGARSRNCNVRMSVCGYSYTPVRLSCRLI